MMHRAALILAVSALPAGCVEEGSQRTHAPLPDPPLASAAPATAMTLATGSAFEDTDRNGWRDSLTVLAYLFAPDSNYPLPLERDGVFTFRLLDARRDSLAEWVFDRAAVGAAMRRDLPPGPGYIFTLDLRTSGREKTDVHEGWIETVFTPFPEGSGGHPVHRESSGALAVGQSR